MYLDMQAMISDLERRLAKEKSIRNKILLEKSIDSLRELERNNSLIK
jgi:hypothetical protein